MSTLVSSSSSSCPRLADEMGVFRVFRFFFFVARAVHASRENRRRVLRPALVTGLKHWHLRPESSFYPKKNFERCVMFTTWLEYCCAGCKALGGVSKGLSIAVPVVKLSAECPKVLRNPIFFRWILRNMRCTFSPYELLHEELSL